MVAIVAHSTNLELEFVFAQSLVSSFAKLVLTKVLLLLPQMLPAGLKKARTRLDRVNASSSAILEAGYQKACSLSLVT
jgi:hypothetical protein